MTPRRPSRSRPGLLGRIGVMLGAALAAVAVFLVAAPAARAQDFVKVDDAAREQLPATPFVAVAYGFIWIALLAYLFVVARGLGRVRDDLRSLRDRLDRVGGTVGGARDRDR